MNTLAWIAAAGCLASVVWMSVEFLRAPLIGDELDDITDDPRPAQVLREAWADRETRGVGL